MMFFHCSTGGAPVVKSVVLESWGTNWKLPIKIARNFWSNISNLTTAAWKVELCWLAPCFIRDDTELRQTLFFDHWILSNTSRMISSRNLGGSYGHKTQICSNLYPIPSAPRREMTFFVIFQPFSHNNSRTSLRITWSFTSYPAHFDVWLHESERNIILCDTVT